MVSRLLGAKRLHPMFNDRFVEQVYTRGVPILAIAAMLSILLFSAVPPNLLFVSGTSAEIIMYSYVGIMAGLIMHPAFRLHQIGVFFAVLTWLGRGGGFVELALARESWALVGAVAERILLATLMVLWHYTQVARIPAPQE